MRFLPPRKILFVALQVLGIFLLLKECIAKLSSPHFGMQKKFDKSISFASELHSITIVKQSPYDATFFVGTTHGLYHYKYDWIQNLNDLSIVDDK